jgi:hypothetical protein
VQVLIGRDGRVAMLLDWDHAMLAPREHDLDADRALARPFCEP